LRHKDDLRVGRLDDDNLRVALRLYADWAFGAERTRLHRERAQIKADATNFCRYIRAKILAEPVRQH